MPLAAAAHQATLAAGVAYAVAPAAAQAVADEVVTTRGRLCAVADRWVPELETARHTLDGTLDELERAEGARLKWAADRQERSG